MAKRISQDQIAKELGVSQSLVSLVLNGRREGVADESYKMIWAAALKQGYVPRGGMQPIHAPDVQHSYVGVVMRSGLALAAQNNTFSHVSHGLFTALQHLNISLAFLGGEGDLDETRLFEVMSRRDPLLGIVVLGEVKEPFMQALGELNMKLVNVYASAPGLCHSIVPNDKQSVEQLVDHLVSLGHTRFAWLGGNSKLGRNRLRLAALQERLAARDLPLDDRCVVNAEGGERQDGFDCAAELVRRSEGRELPTAWVCHNGLIARGGLQFAYLRGIKVPEEISIAAVDRTRVCTEIHPHLTSAASDPELIGVESAKLLRAQPEEVGQWGKMLIDLVAPSVFEAGETSATCAG
jgi:LacI family transcriptional regulator